MLKNYVAPNGRTYQYEEGTQPNGFVPADGKQPPKRRAAANKARTAADKKARS